MARLLTTGFETGTYENNGGLFTGTGTNVQVQSTVRRTGAYALQVPCGVNPNGYIVQIVSDVAEIYFRIAFRHGHAGSGDGTNTKLLSFHEGGTEHVSIGITSDTLLSRLVVRGSTADTGSIVFSQSTWYMIEGYVKIANSGGAVTVKVNGTTDLTYSGDTCATANEFMTSIRIGAQSGMENYSYYFDDVAINDTAGDYQNSWIGLGGIFYLEPTADGTTNDWTPSSGTVNYAMVDDIPPDNATTFVQALDTADRDLYVIDDCPQYVNTINLVEVVYRAAVAESGYNYLRDVVYVAGTAYTGLTSTIVPITPSFTYYHGTVHYINPNTGTAWGTAEVNAMEAGIEVA